MANAGLGDTEKEDDILSNIRTILEIQVLYSISISDFGWT